MLDEKRDWQDNSNKYKIVFMHNPYINGQRDDKEDGVFLNYRETFLHVCNRYAFDIVLCGHDHSEGIDDGGIWNKSGDNWSEDDLTKFVMTDSIKDDLAYRKIFITDKGLDVGEVEYLLESGSGGGGW